MHRKLDRSRQLLLLATLVLGLATPCVFTRQTFGWSNGGFSTDPNNPDYGTHDFIAHHTLDYVPDDLDFWLRENLQAYLYGTELPDNRNAPLGDGIGDTMLHHVYYFVSGQLQDDSSARRAQASYEQTLTYLMSGDYRNAAKWMGVTSHYVADLAVFGHVMGKSTDWGAEKHHSDYEDWANSNTNSYDAPFKTCLVFDGKLAEITAYQATLTLAHDTTFDDSDKGHTAKWMDSTYNPASPEFKARTCESIALSVNLVADVIYTAAKATNIPEFQSAIAPLIIILVLLTVVVTIRKYKRTLSRRDEK